MNKDKANALLVTFIGMVLACIILGSLFGAYLNTPEDEHTKIDIAGTVSIIVVSIIYWIVFTRVWCISYNLAALWPRLAFRYGLGAGIFFALFRNLVHSSENYIDQYVPLLVLSLIFGNYFFMFMEIASMDIHNCEIKISML